MNDNKIIEKNTLIIYGIILPIVTVLVGVILTYYIYYEPTQTKKLIDSRLQEMLQLNETFENCWNCGNYIENVGMIFFQYYDHEMHLSGITFMRPDGRILDNADRNTEWIKEYMNESR